MLGVESEVMVVSFAEGGRHAFNWFPGRQRVIDATNSSTSMTFDEYLAFIASWSTSRHLKVDAQGRYIIARYRNALTISEEEFLSRKKTAQQESANVAAEAQIAADREARINELQALLIPALEESQARRVAANEAVQNRSS